MIYRGANMALWTSLFISWTSFYLAPWLMSPPARHVKSPTLEERMPVGARAHFRHALAEILILTDLKNISPITALNNMWVLGAQSLATKDRFFLVLLRDVNEQGEITDSHLFYLPPDGPTARLPASRAGDVHPHRYPGDQLEWGPVNNEEFIELQGTTFLLHDGTVLFLLPKGQHHFRPSSPEELKKHAGPLRDLKKWSTFYYSDSSYESLEDLQTEAFAFAQDLLELSLEINASLPPLESCDHYLH